MSINVQATVINEVRAALQGGKALTTAELVPLCNTAEDTKALSRIIYVMRRERLIAEDPEPGPRGGDGKPSKRYRWVGPTDGYTRPAKRPAQSPAKTQETIEDEAAGGTTRASVSSTPEPARHIPMEEIAESMTHKHPILYDRTDPTEAAMSDLVDQADEALLTLADSLLSDHPVWSLLRTLAEDAFGALCNYRLLRSLEETK